MQKILEIDESDWLIHNLKSGTDKMAADFVNSFNSSIMTFILKIILVISNCQMRSTTQGISG